VRTSLLLAATLVVGFTAGQVLSKDESRRSKEEITQALERYGKPGAQHEVLKALEGNFDVRAKAQVEPGKEKETAGKSEIKSIFGGLFIQENVEGTCPYTGKSFHGLNYVGFDNLKKKYVSSWISSLGSGICNAEGTADPSGKVITFTGKSSDPITGKEQATRSVLTIQDDNKLRYEMFGQGPDGKEIKHLTLDYTRSIGK
jgi:hypothetical protein